MPTRKRFLARPQLSYPCFQGSLCDRIGQPLSGSYLSSLPLPCLPAVPPAVNWQSEIPTLDECRSLLTTALPLLRVFSGWLRYVSWLRLPSHRGFPGKRFQKATGTRHTTSTPTNTQPHHTLSNAPSSGCNYRLELYRDPGLHQVPELLGFPSAAAAVFGGAFFLAPLLTPHQPTCRATSAAFRLRPWAGQSPAFMVVRHSPVTREPVSVSPNF